MQHKCIGSTTTRMGEKPIEMSDLPDHHYILVVDDDEAIISVVMLALETDGLTGMGLSDSQKVLPFLTHMGPGRLPSAILLDLMMPGLSGYQIASELAQDENYSSIPVIIMTADYRVRDAGAVPGAVDLISKPFHMDALLTKMEHYLLHTKM